MCFVAPEIEIVLGGSSPIYHIALFSFLSSAYIGCCVNLSAPDDLNMMIICTL